MVMPWMLACCSERAIFAGDVEEGVGLEFLRIVAGETEFGHAIDECGVGREERVAVEFLIVHGTGAGEGAGLGGEGCGEVRAVAVEIGERDAGEAAHRFIIEVGCRNDGRSEQSVSVT